MSNNWEVRQIQESDETGYNDFINQVSKLSPSVLGYHYSFYKKTLEICRVGEAYYLGLYSDNKLRAILPGFIKKSDLGVVYSSMPFFGPNAGILALPGFETIEVHQVLIEYLVKYLSGLPGMLSASFYTPFLSEKSEWYKQLLQADYTVDKTTQYLEIQNIEWTPKIKYDLRKADKLGLVISTEITDDAVDRLYSIYIQNCTDYSIPPKPRECINALATASKNGENVDFYFAIAGNEIVGGLIVLYSESTISYYLPCALDSARTLQPTTVMIDKCFRHAKQKGLRYWNWEASPGMGSGVYQFKKKWGSLTSEYKIFIKTFQPKEVFEKLGKAKISKEFPYFFVFPFHLID